MPAGFSAPRMRAGSPDMWTSDNISVGMLTSSNAVAISSSVVVNGCPACGLRTVSVLPRRLANWNMFQKSVTPDGREPRLRCVDTAVLARVNGSAPPDVPLSDIDLGSWKFWVADDDLRDGAFATLRREAPVSFHAPLETPGVQEGPGHWAITR